MSGHRPKRVADLVRHLLAQALGELRDPRVGFVTVTEVALSPDLKHARVFVSVLGDPAGTLEALHHAEPYLRRTLAARAGLRHTPDLRFVIDPSVAHGAKVEEILERLHREAPGDEEPKA